MISSIGRAACGAALVAMGTLAIPSAADASVIWDVNGTFSDGTPLTGSFTTDVYGYVQNWDLSTQSNGAFTGMEYKKSPTDYKASGFNFVDFQPGYFGDLHLEFTDSLTVPGPHNFIVDAASYECQGSFNCYIPADGPTRYLTGGVADFASTVPEPATCAMLILGFGMTGAALRMTGRRKALTSALG